VGKGKIRVKVKRKEGSGGTIVKRRGVVRHAICAYRSVTNRRVPVLSVVFSRTEGSKGVVGASVKELC